MNAQQSERVERLLDEIYDAAGNDQLWPGVIVRISDLVGGGGGVIHGFSYSTYRVLNNLSYIGGLDEICLRIAQERHLNNLWTHAMARQPDGRIVLSDDIVPLSALSRTDFYNEAVRPQSLPHNAMATMVRQDDAVLAFNISRYKPFREEHRIVLDRLLPDIRRSFMLGLRFEGYRALLEARQHVLDQLPEGIVLLDRAGCVLFANRAARGCEALSISRVDARMRAIAIPQQRRLDGAMQAVMEGASSAAVLLHVPGHEKPLSVLLVRARESVLDRLATSGLGGVALIMFIRDPARAARVPAQTLMDVYDLTPAEARVALKAGEGLDTALISRSLGLSHNTVKTHLRRIYSKTGVERQFQLVRLIEGFELA